MVRVKKISKRAVATMITTGTGQSTKTRAKIKQKSTKNRSKIVENRPKIDEKSMKIRCWVVLGVQSRFRHAPGRARDGLGTPKTRSWSDLEPPGTRQERPGAVQKRSRASPEPPPDRPESTSGRERSVERCRTRLRNDFSSFLSCRANAPMCQIHSSCQCFVHFEQS